MGYILIYVTCPNKNSAKKIAKELLEEKLIACANIANIDSMYSWKGKVEESKEVLLLAKTRSSLFKKIKKRILDLHSYEVPCIISLPIIKGNKEYLEWIKKTTS